MKRAYHVVVVVAHRLGYRLPHSLQARKMHHCVNRSRAIQDDMECGCITHITLNYLESAARKLLYSPQGFGRAVAEIVEGSDIDTVFQQMKTGM